MPTVVQNEVTPSPVVPLQPTAETPVEPVQEVAPIAPNKVPTTQATEQSFVLPPIKTEVQQPVQQPINNQVELQTLATSPVKLPTLESNQQ